MALEASDLFVVQKAAGDIRKVTATDLNTFLEGGQTVVYKGVASFIDAGDNPGTPVTGDLWINNALAAGTFAWTPAPDQPVTVNPGDRCIYNGTGWDIISSGVADAGVETVSANLPITVNDDDAANVVIGVNAATTDDPGVVQLATAQDLTDESPTRVVTADQLQKVIEDLDAATAGGVVSVQGVDPIETHTDGTNGGSVNSPAISIKDAGASQKGAITKLPSTTDVGGPVSNTDEATWKAGLDDAAAITLKLVGANFLLSDFTEYPDA